MTAFGQRLAANWTRVGMRYLPFADAASDELPLPRLLRLSLFQVSVGMATTLLIGTLNRVMIVELSVPTWLVALMVSLPLVFAPLRAVIGFRSDTHRSVLGWRRVPYIWFGTLLQFGGLAIMPFSLLILSGDTHGPVLVGQIAAALAFLLVGAGLHMTQTVGLALATDVAPAETQPRVVALMCTMLLAGMAVSAVLFGVLLADFTQLRLIEVIQGSAVVTVLLNVTALWKQEIRDPARTAFDRVHPSFRQSWQTFGQDGCAVRRLVALGVGTLAFGMQDVLLEPYGGEVLKLPVGATTALTALYAVGGIAGFVIAARALLRGVDAYRMAALGAVMGLAAFSSVILAAPLDSPWMFACGVSLVGFGSGLFAHCTLTAAMKLAPTGQIGLAIGLWGAVQATAAGGGIALGGLIRDLVSGLAKNGSLGPALNGPEVGYGAVYGLEILLLFATLAIVGPLVRSANLAVPSSPSSPAWAPGVRTLQEEVVP